MQKILLILSTITLLMMLATGCNNKQKEDVSQPAIVTESAFTTSGSVETSTEQAITSTEQAVNATEQAVSTEQSIK